MSTETPVTDYPQPAPKAGPRLALSPLRPKLIFGAVGLAFGLLLGVGGTAAVLANGAQTAPASAATASATKIPVSDFVPAVRDCTSSSYASLGDSGYSVVLDGQGAKDSGGLDMTDIACILKKLNVPDSVIAQMDSTRALDGMQKASWGRFSASWTYHPDNGMNVILSESR